MHLKPSQFSIPSLFLPLFLLYTSIQGTLATDASLEFLDPTLPPALPSQTPKCSVLVLHQDFAGTVSGSSPVTTNYTHPGDCPAPWTRVVLELSFSVSGVHVQKDRVAAVWIDGAEILRTSTPFTINPGAFWKVHKDITRYTSLLRRLSGGRGTVSMMLENSDSDSDSDSNPPGVLTADVSLHFYRGALSDKSIYTAHPSVKGLYREPADLVVPISQEKASNGSSFWFQIGGNSDMPTASVVIPTNAYRAVLEIFASYHADDEFWYANPLQSEYPQGGLREGRANGGLRQLYATIDGKFVGGHIPFAVIYPGSINPYLWSPVAAIGAFDMPTYDLEVTPFLGLLVDGQPHEIGLGVKHSQSYWLLTANLHLWVDRWTDAVEAMLVDYRAPPLRVNPHAEWRDQEGSSEIDAEGLLRFIGWVSSSKGNVTTMVRQKVTFKSQVVVQNRGTVRQVEVVNKEAMTVGAHRGKNQVVGRLQLFMDAPLQVQMSIVNAAGGAVLQNTRLYHQLEEVLNLNDNMAVSTSILTDRQDAEGTVLMHDGMPVWGGGSTKSSYKYRDENTCYLRTVDAAGGAVKNDVTSPSCSLVSTA
ncbi:peptide-N4-(N-acetyl-beta-glucosaminyl)asparagine amidase A [Cocos nucifera]|uniref:Peptide-N4-(N-acetyl-beta-glucosaminyl)asparagine amidase A n=1 Tax=Cocos nucifera TaxID=13894 RepID=A0A8K0I5V9_COCNU|nr:peptide-N4-(N-acetyl-beta-glucosaminyl)asparagine amidase A [Cocos nucifera]